MKVFAITQARMGSTRLPGKVFEQVGGKPLLQLHLERLRTAKRVDKVIVATTEHQRDDRIEEAANTWGFQVARGSEEDVLGRFVKAVGDDNPDYIVRVTSDCPFVDPALIDQIIEYTVLNNADYCSNTLIEHFPDGQDIEVVRWDALKMAHREAKLPSDREHVTPYIKRNSSFSGNHLFNALNYPAPADFNAVRMCVDEPNDLIVARALADGCGVDADWMTYTRYYLGHPEIAEMNATIVRNEGYLKSVLNDRQGETDE